MTSGSGPAPDPQRKIAVLTVGRSDFGIYESILVLLKDDPAFDLRLLVSGAHFAPSFGMTVTEIEGKGFDYELGLEMLLASDSPQGLSKSVGLGVISLAQTFAVDKPDILLVLGDRMDMVCGPIAAMAFNIPVAHIHGGAVTEGAVDDLVRHAITKMSHLHFVSCQQYADRVVQMGEEHWRVINVGAPALDGIAVRQRLSQDELYERVGLDLSERTLLATYHPVTLEPQQVGPQVDAMLAAVDETGCQAVLTYPNADVGSATIIERFREFTDSRPGRVALLKNAGTEVYLSLMATVAAMVGNSSSGIVEAPSLRLPVVNIGTRQQGKVRAGNVIDVGYSREEIAAGIRLATSPEFAQGLQDLESPYGDGRSGQKIIEVLRSISIDDRLLRKKFVDLPR